MDIEKFRELCNLVVECYINNGWHEMSGGKFHHERHIDEHATAVLEWFDCPKDWQPIIKLCVQGADYYGFEEAVFGRED